MFQLSVLWGCFIAPWSVESLLAHPPLVFQDGLTQMGSLTSHSRAALADTDDAIQVCLCR